MPDRPSSMYTNGRPTIDKFDASEQLYRRVLGKDWGAGDAHPWIDMIPFYPEMSTNRSTLSLPHQVLYPPCPTDGDLLEARITARNMFADYGVIRIAVGALLIEPREVDGKTYSWTIRHMPDPCNYAHSALLTFVNDHFSPDLKIKSKTLKANYRQLIAQNAFISYSPGEAADLYGT